MSEALFTVPPWMLAGVVAGGLYFSSLHWSVRRFVSGRSLPAALTVQLLRLGALAAVLALVAIHRGAIPLLAMAGGILVARMACVRWARRG